MKDEFIEILNKLILEDNILKKNITQVLFMPNVKEYILTYEINDLSVSTIQSITFKEYFQDEKVKYVILINEYYFCSLDYMDIFNLLDIIYDKSSIFNIELLEYVKNLI